MLAKKVKERLKQLTGSSEVKINNRDYMVNLRTKITQEYERTARRHEHEREELEEQRMRRLMIDGVISRKQLVAAGYACTPSRRPLSIDSRTIKTAPHARSPAKRRHRNSKKKCRSKSAPSAINDRSTCVTTLAQRPRTGHAKNGGFSSDVVQRSTSPRTQTATRPKSSHPSARSVFSSQQEAEPIPSPASSVVQRSERRRSRESGRESTGWSDRTLREMYEIEEHPSGEMLATQMSRLHLYSSSSAGSSSDELNEDVLYADEYVSRDVSLSSSDVTSVTSDESDSVDSVRHQNQSCRYTYEHPMVVELRNEPTVAGLYAIAERLIVPSSKTDSTSVRRKRPVSKTPPKLKLKY